jgi:hypothetical protein
MMRIQLALLFLLAACADPPETATRAQASDAECVTLADGDSAQPTDNAPALQACLDRAGTQPRGHVKLPPGVYGIRRALSIPSGVTLEGAGADRTTLRLTALDTPALPLVPPECDGPDPGFPPSVPSAAIYNPGNQWFLSHYWYDPNNGRCYANGAVYPAPADHDIGLSHLTVDCNGEALWHGQASEGNAGCLYFEHLSGLTMDDVVERDGAVDGMDLGWGSDLGVDGFRITHSHFQHNRRFGFGWIEASDGLFEDSSFDDNGGGGLDMESDAAVYRFHDVRFHRSAFTGRPNNPAYDYGIILALDQGPFVNSNLDFDDVTVSGFRAYGLMLAWGGAYDLRFRGEMRDLGLGCVVDSKSALDPTAPHRMELSGQFVHCSTNANNPAVRVGEDGARGWEIGPLTIDQTPSWSNGSLLWLEPGNRDFLIHDVQARLTCDHDSSGCAASNFMYQTGYPAGTLDPSNVVSDSAMIFCGGALGDSPACLAWPHPVSETSPSP